MKLFKSKASFFHNDRIRLMLLSLALIASTIFATSNIRVFSYISFGIICWLLCTGTNSENFYIIVSLTLFEYVTLLRGINIIFIYFLIASVKLLLNKCILNFRIILVIYAAFFIAGIEFVFDFFGIKLGEFINWFAGFLYYILFVLRYDFIEYDHQQSIKYYTFSYIIIVLGTLAASGGFISKYMFNSTGEMLRLGEEARYLGGAMIIPLATSILISLLFVYLVKKQLSLLKGIGLYALIIFSILVGFLSISKVFLLDLAVIVFWVVLSLTGRHCVQLIKVIIILVGGAFVFVISNMVTVRNIINNFLFRLNAFDISSGRYEIWESCINYLINNPSSLLWGLGAKNYVQVGFREGYKFSMMAHNIYLDAIMSWGVLGTIALVYIIRYFYLKCKQSKLCRPSLLLYMPITVVLVHYLTTGTFNFVRNFTYILLFTLHLFFAEKQHESLFDPIDERT